MKISISCSSFLIGFLILGGCATVDPVETSPMVVLSVDPDGVHPKDLEIPVFSSVAWFNNIGKASKIQIFIDRSITASQPCSTLLGFSNDGDGASTPAGIEDSQWAVMCFHEPGEYTYRITGTEKPLSGTITAIPKR